jgi:predicted lipid-binding transport protein (Tim44 family)
MKRPFRLASLLPVLAIGLVLSFSIADSADAARRGGGGFGSRGARTYQVPRSTATAPQAAQPIERTMTPRTQATAPGAQRPAAATAQQQRRPGFLGGLGGGLLGGLLLGGLVGMLLGHGFGGMAGLLGLIVQAGLIALVVMVVVRLLARRSAPQPAYAGAAPPPPMQRDRLDDLKPAGGATAAVRTSGHDEIGVQDKDFDQFERLLVEIQTAYGREDYAALRELTAPEVMGFLAEELAKNASEGRRNEITQVKLLQGDLSEAWREADDEYATVAMRYASIDCVRDRTSGQVLEGDPERPVETTEIWTFRREGGPWGGGWKLSAVQTA